MEKLIEQLKIDLWEAWNEKHQDNVTSESYQYWNAICDERTRVIGMLEEYLPKVEEAQNIVYKMENLEYEPLDIYNLQKSVQKL